MISARPLHAIAASALSPSFIAFEIPAATAYMFFVAPRLQVHHVVGGRVDTEVVAGQDLLPAFCLAFLKGGKGDGGGARPMSTSSAWLGPERAE